MLLALAFKKGYVTVEVVGEKDDEEIKREDGEGVEDQYGEYSI